MSLHDEITAFTPGMFWSNEHASGYSRAIADVAELATKADAEISRLIGENAVLRDLLRDVLSLIRDIECDCLSPEGTDNLRVRIDGALNGQGRYIPRDGQIYAETSRRADPKAQLGNLLAVIHRDGGRYLATHGVENACAGAEAKVAKWIMMETGIDAMIEQAARAERESCAIIAISPICGSQGFAGPSCCILAPGHKGGHKYGTPRDRTAGEIAAAIRARSASQEKTICTAQTADAPERS